MSPRPLRMLQVALAGAATLATAPVWASAPATCPAAHLAHGRAQAEDPAALELLIAAQGPEWTLFRHRVELPGCAELPRIPGILERRAHRRGTDEHARSPDDIAQELLRSGPPPAVSGGRVTSRRLRQARAALCAAPRLGGPGACGGPTVHTPTAPEWTPAPPWLVRIAREDVHEVEVHLRVPLGSAAPEATTAAAHRLGLAFSGPLHRALREETGLVYDLGAALRVSPGRSVLALQLRVPPQSLVALLRAGESVRRALALDPVGTLGGRPALAGSARALAVSEVLGAAVPVDRSRQELVSFVTQGDPHAPGWSERAWSEAELTQGAVALAAAPWTWLVVGDPERVDAILAAAGLVPDLRLGPDGR